MKLVVGLGNPGRKYAGTRHNVGYDVLACLAQRYATSGPRSAFHGEVVEAQIEGSRVLLLWPHTYMNRSGTSVLAARDFYKLETKELLILADDFHLPLGKLRFRTKGSAGGQKGLADVIRCLGTEEIARLRLGIGPLPEHFDPADFVLARFSKTDDMEIKIAVAEAADAVGVWCRDGAATCMNRFN